MLSIIACCDWGSFFGYDSLPVAYGADISKAWEEPVPLLGGQEHPQLFRLDKMLHHDVQAAAVGRLRGHNLKPHLVGEKQWGALLVSK